MQSETWRHIRGRGARCDARALPYRAGSFAAVISIYNLEHISNLDLVCREVSRVLMPGGTFLVALPCEGGLLWNLGREVSTKRVFERQFGINYDKVIAFEHVWDLPGVVGEINRSGLFHIRRTKLFPFSVPLHHLNLIACLECISNRSARAELEAI